MCEITAKILAELADGPRAVRDLYNFGSQDGVRNAIRQLLQSGKVAWIGKQVLGTLEPGPDLEPEILRFLADGPASCVEVLDCMSIATNCRRGAVSDSLNRMLREGKLRWVGQRQVEIVE